MKYIGNLNGERREVNQDEYAGWAWAVLNKDNTVVRQFEEDGTFTFIGQLNQDHILMFTVYNHHDDRRFDIIVPRGAKVFMMGRNISMGNKVDWQKCIIFGYKLGGKSVYNHIMPSGQVVQSDKDNIHLPDFIAPLQNGAVK